LTINTKTKAVQSDLMVNLDRWRSQEAGDRKYSEH